MRPRRSWRVVFAVALLTFLCRGPEGIAQSTLGSDLLMLPMAEPLKEVQDPKSPLVIQPEGDAPISPAWPPNETASLRVLDESWKYLSFYPETAKLSPALQERLLAVCEAYPDDAAQLAGLVPQTQASFARLYALVSKAHDDPDGPGPREHLRRYLSEHSNYFRSDLIARARRVSEDTASASLDDQDAVDALARLDYAAASPILAKMARGKATLLVALGLSLQLAHAIASEPEEIPALRARLMVITQDRKAPAQARDMAMEALMTTPWPERDRWFLSLFGDESLTSLSDGTSLFSPLNTWVRADPDYWIPKISPLVLSGDPRVRLNAVCVLTSFQYGNSRADALIPLLPWLTSPQWADPLDSGCSRLNMIHSLTLVHVPEAADGLLYLADHPEQAETFEFEGAIEALTLLHDRRVVPILQKTLRKPSNVRERREVLKALLSMDAYTFDEKIAAVLAFAEAKTHSNAHSLDELPSDEDAEDQPTDVRERLGEVILRVEGDQPSLTGAIRKRVQSLDRTQPEQARDAGLLDQVLHALPDAERDHALLDGLAKENATVEMIWEVHDRADWFRKDYPEELKKMLDIGGVAKAVGAYTLQDSSAVDSILEGSDMEAKKALLGEIRAFGEFFQSHLLYELEDSSDSEIARAATECLERRAKIRFIL